MISNRAAATFAYSSCNAPLGTSVSNTVVTTVAVNVSGSVYSQQISDLIHSIALEEAAIAGIVGVEGVKIQRMLAIDATPNELLCVNKSVSDDIEDITQHHLTNAQRTDLAEAFCRRVAQEKYHTAVYTSLSWFNTMLELPRLAAYGKWIAQWDVPKCGFAGSVQLWQNSSKGKIDGILGDVDTNLCYFDYPVIGQKLLANNATIIVNTQKTTFGLSAGTRVFLSGTPLFASSATENQIGHFSGQYWIYDGVAINGRMRLTNQQARVGMKPESTHVTGYVDVTALSSLNGTGTT